MVDPSESVAEIQPYGIGRPRATTGQESRNGLTIGFVSLPIVILVLPTYGSYRRGAPNGRKEAVRRETAGTAPADTSQPPALQRLS